MGVLLIQPNWSAASELWSQRMIAALRPHLVALGTPQPGAPASHDGVPVVALRDTRPAAWRWYARRLRLPVALQPARTAADVLAGAVARLDVTVVLAHYLEFALCYEDVWASTDKPLFVHCHGYDTEWDLRKWEAPDEPVFGPDYLPRVRRLSRRAVLIANSQCTARRLYAGGISPQRVVVKYLGVPVPPRPPMRPACTTGLEILFLGRLVDCKAPDLTILAFERACALGLDARLTLAGDGPLRVTCELLRRRSRYADRIRLLGTVAAETGARLRARADIVTAHNCRGPVSRQEEALGVSYIEAMATGLPVVTGRRGGVCETVVDGETGVLFEPGDVEAHAEALLQMAHEPALRQRLGAAGWARARDCFSAEQERAELLRILGLASPAPPPSSFAAEPTTCGAPA